MGLSRRNVEGRQPSHRHENHGVETLLGFVGGNVLGTLVGLALWYSRFVSRVVQPFVVALGSIPIIALAPICIIWFGTGLVSKSRWRRCRWSW